MTTAAGAAQVFPGTPCCAVKAIDAQARMLTVVDNASGRIFQVRVTNPAAMSGIKVGSKLYGNSGLNIFSVDHVSPCCNVMP
jgi:Cu/Ag efflux protein CusF